MLLMMPVYLVVANVNSPPTKPHITGPSNGKVGSIYDYGFCSTDPDGDQIFYCIDWGDDTGEVCIGPFPSDTCIYESHTYTIGGTFIIKAKADDGELESDWSELEVTMPRGKLSLLNTYLMRLLERFPNMIPILRLLLN
jgi:hypothetical protein